jgi:endo-1,4-beta-xylanase
MVLLALLLVQGVDDPKDESELLATAQQRIEKHRMGEFTVTITDRDGKPLRDTEVTITQIRHEFLFGANIFPLFTYKTQEQNDLYAKRFADLLNYATLGFYWGSYERESGKTERDHWKRVAQWCRGHDIATKGHPLVWHQVYPAWAPQDPDKAKEALKARVQREVRDFAGLIDRWDVVNEATVSAQQGTGVGAWAKRDGAAAMVAECLEWAHEANPRAILLYNDFNLSQAYEDLAADLKKRGAPVHVLGIQSHMHSGEWELMRAWGVCERFKRFGLPLHFTELTVLSGEYKKGGDWQSRRADWPSTPEGEKRQADYVEKLYTVLFSHPAVEAITWWDLMDGGWMGAPAGLVRRDLSPKPAYERLMSLIHDKWTTKLTTKTDDEGKVRFRGFYGTYTIRAGETGAKVELSRSAPRSARVRPDQREPG